MKLRGTTFHQKEKNAQMLEKIPKNTEWSEYLELKDVKEETAVLKECVSQYLDMDFQMDWRNDKTFASEGTRMEAIAQKTAVLKKMIEKHPEAIEKLPTADQEALKIKLNAGVKISEYYKIQKKIMMDAEYRTHYNSEISKKQSSENTKERNQLAVMLRKAEYYKEMEHVSCLFSEEDLTFDKLLEVLKDPAMKQKDDNISWQQLFDNISSMTETEAAFMLVKKAAHPKIQEVNNTLGKEYYLKKCMEGFTSGILKKQAEYLTATFFDIAGSEKEMAEVGLQSKEAQEKYKKFLVRFSEVGAAVDSCDIVLKQSEEMMEQLKEIKIENGYAPSVLAGLRHVKSQIEQRKDMYINIEGQKLLEEFALFVGEQNIWLEFKNKDYAENEMQKEVEKVTSNIQNQNLVIPYLANEDMGENLWIQQGAPLYEVLREQSGRNMILKEGISNEQIQVVLAQYNIAFAKFNFLKTYFEKEDTICGESYFHMLYEEKRCEELQKQIEDMVHLPKSSVAEDSYQKSVERYKSGEERRKEIVRQAMKKSEVK